MLWGENLAPSAIDFGIVFGAPKAFASREADPPFAKRAKVERVVLNALAKRMRLCRLICYRATLGGQRTEEYSCALGGWFLASSSEKPIHLNVLVRMDR